MLVAVHAAERIGADLDAIGSVSCDTVAFEDWHLTECYDRQDDVNKKVREHYRKTCRRKIPLAKMDMSAPELIAAARKLAITLGEDGRLQRNKHNTDSRSGRKPGTNKRPARDYIGYESTKIVATRTHTHDPKTGTVTLGPAVSALRVGQPPGVGQHQRRPHQRLFDATRSASGHQRQARHSRRWDHPKERLVQHQGHRAEPAGCTAPTTPTTSTEQGDIVNIVIGENKKKTHTVKVHCGELFHKNTPKSHITPPQEYFALDEKPKDDETEDEREAREDRNEQRANTRSEWLTERHRWKYDIHQRLDHGRQHVHLPIPRRQAVVQRGAAHAPKLRDGAKFVKLPADTTTCCNGTFIATRKHLVKIGHQEPAYFSPEHAEVYVQRIPVEGRFGTDQQKGAYEPRSCRAPLLEAHAIAALVFDAIGNLPNHHEQRDRRTLRTDRQLRHPHRTRRHRTRRHRTRRHRTRRHRTRRHRTADTEPADTEPADTEPASAGPDRRRTSRQETGQLDGSADRGPRTAVRDHDRQQPRKGPSRNRRLERCPRARRHPHDEADGISPSASSRPHSLIQQPSEP